MNLVRTLLLSTLVAGKLFSQPDVYVVSQKGSVSLTPAYERWSGGGTEIFSESSAALSIYQPLGREASVGVRGTFASTTGSVTSLNGVNDAQMTIRYHVEPANLMLGVGLNFPSGKKELTPEEFETALLVSNALFRVPVPQYGTGFNVATSATWAIPVNDDFVIGIGALYQYKGSFVPLVDFGRYDPGDEVSLTGGCDARLDPTLALSIDGVFTLYGKDKLDGVEVFAPGNKILAAMQIRKYLGRDDLTFQAIFRTRSRSKLPMENVFLATPDRTEPDQFDITASYAAQLSTAFLLRFSGGWRFLQETPDSFSGAKLFDVGLGPEMMISDCLSLPVHVGYSFGKSKGNITVTGIEAGFGVVLTY